MSAAVEQRNQDATVYVGNLADSVHEELLWELFVQVGPVIHVHMPKDKISGAHLNYGFVEFQSEADAEYASKVLNMIGLYGQSMKVKRVSQDRKGLDVGANLFVGSLDEDVDDKLLYDTFSSFGNIIRPPRVMRDQETGRSRGFGFVSYDSFEAADYAISCMDGQHLLDRQINVQYALKKDSKTERHGSQAERLLARDSKLAKAQAAGGVAAAAAPSAVSGAPPGFVNQQQVYAHMPPPPQQMMMNMPPPPPQQMMNMPHPPPQQMMNMPPPPPQQMMNMPPPPPQQMMNMPPHQQMMMMPPPPPQQMMNMPPQQQMMMMPPPPPPVRPT